MFHSANQSPTPGSTHNPTVSSKTSTTSPLSATDASDVETKPASSLAPFFTLEVPQKLPEDVEVTDRSDLSKADEEGATITGDDGSESRELARKERCAATKPAQLVHFADEAVVQPYSMTQKPKDVRAFEAFAQKTSDKLSWLRNQNMYDESIRLHVRGSKLNAPLVFKIGQFSNLLQLGAQIVLLGILDVPFQVQYLLDERSQPLGYDIGEDEKRFQFGKRGNEEFPKFIERCQKAARARAVAEEAKEEREERGQAASGSNDKDDKKTIGIIELKWKN
jgi:hypothetical protein